MPSAKAALSLEKQGAQGGIAQSTVAGDGTENEKCEIPEQLPNRCSDATMRNRTVQITI
jgi:hypothetical protein